MDKQKNKTKSLEITKNKYINLEELTDNEIEIVVQKVKLTDRILRAEKEGKTFKFDSITKDEMLDLYINFRFDDAGISAIFDVDKIDVMIKREDMGINREDGVILQLERYNKQIKDVD